MSLSYRPTPHADIPRGQLGTNFDFPIYYLHSLAFAMVI
jgi:hypothetical protein